MKANNAIAGLCHGMAARTCLVILLAATIFFSCTKNAEPVAVSKPVASPGDEAGNIAKIMNGTMLEGSMVVNSDEKNMAIIFNRGSKYILVEKIPGMPEEDVNSIKSAVLITSPYGIIIKDMSNNKTFLLPNNDAESLQKFEEVKKYISGSYVSSVIFGTTIING